MKDHPYFAVTDKNGNFEIKHLPAGMWRFRAWHERGGYLHKVVRGMTKETWNHGRFEATIKEGEKNLRQIYIRPSFFRFK